MINIDLKEYGKTIVLTLRGDLVFDNANEAEKVFFQHLEKKPEVIGIDCKNLEILDSSGLGIFIKVSKDVAKMNSKLLFIDISDHVSTLLDVSKLNDMFELISREEFENSYLK